LAIFSLFLLSGATSLVYEVLWLRKLILIFGSTQFATSTILSTFMGGLALGAFVAGRRITRSHIAPLKIYGLLEIGIGVYALFVPFLFRFLSPVYQALWDAGMSESFVALSVAKFVGIAVVLLPPTVMMGATLPVLARQIADDPKRIGGKVGTLYAINTFGAVAGTFLAGFVFVPHLGVRQTLWMTAAVNGLLGLTAMWLAGRLPRPGSTVSATPSGDAASPPVPDSPGLIAARRRMPLVLLVFGLSGFGALVLEVAWTRVLALVMGSSVYAFSLMLLAFLVGLAIGSACFAGYLRKRPGTDPAAMLGVLLISAGFLAYATSWAFRALPRTFAEIYFWTQAQTDWLTGSSALSANQWMVVQFLCGLLIMFPATFALGGIFPAVLQLHARKLDRVGTSVGTVYASNTVGTIVGAAMAGFVLIPAFGMLNAVNGIAILEVALGTLIVFAVVARPHRLRPAILLTVVVVCGLFFRFPQWDARLMNSGVYMNLFDEGWTDWESFSKIIYENNEPVFVSEGLTATVFVADQPRYQNRYLSVNGKIEASTSADLETQLMCSHLPLIMHAAPKDVMVIGLASGITVGAVATHPVETIRVIEVEKEMEPAARLFEEHNNYVLDDPRLVLSFNDARNDLEFSSNTYDVIISEPSNPWMTVAANLFTEDFFRMAKTRLRAGGIFSQWVQNYYLPKEDLRSIIAAFRDSFPYVMLFETYDGIDLLLLGSQEPMQLDLERFDKRMTELRVLMDLGRVGIRKPSDVLELFRLGPQDIDKVVAGAPRNTDDNARVEFSAPKTFGVYTVGQNLEYLRQFVADPVDHVTPEPSPEEADELRLRIARGLFLRQEYDLARLTLEWVKLPESTTRVADLTRKIDQATSAP
jgi:spermidine synthase